LWIALFYFAFPIHRVFEMLEDWRPAWLGLFTRQQLVDIGKAQVPALADYDRAVQEMDADRTNSTTKRTKSRRSPQPM